MQSSGKTRHSRDHECRPPPSERMRQLVRRRNGFQIETFVRRRYELHEPFGFPLPFLKQRVCVGRDHQHWTGREAGG